MLVEHYRCPRPATSLSFVDSTNPSTVESDIAEIYDEAAALAPIVSARGGRRMARPTDIIADLRHERYVDPRLTPSRSLRNAYYRLRSLLPAYLRKHVQRAYLRGWQELPFPGWPIDSTVDSLLERLLAVSLRRDGIDRTPFVWFWPDGASSAALMTHDVERLAGRNFSLRLMDLDDSVGIKSSFEIVPEGRYHVPAAFLDDIRTRGFEVNVHDLNHDGRLFSSHSAFLQRVGQINSYGKRYRALGFRSGGLYRNQAWYDALDFSYDMSVPNTAHLDPQRGGCCTIMPFFVGRVLELPLTTSQDYSLFHILNDYSIDLWKQQLRLIMERHGLATFLVHPDYIIEKRARKTYQALLEHLTRLREEKRLWIALPGEVDSWWRKRSRMSIVQEGGKWAIRGPGSERARLAFATLNDDSLSFTVEGR